MFAQNKWFDIHVQHLISLFPGFAIALLDASATGFWWRDKVKEEENNYQRGEGGEGQESI